MTIYVEKPKKKPKISHWGMIGIVLAILGIPGIIIGYPALKEQIHRWKTPDYKLVDEQNHKRGKFNLETQAQYKTFPLKGLLIPGSAFNSHTFNLYFGSCKVTNSDFGDLQNGVDLARVGFGCPDIDPIILRMINNRLYISASFSDYETKQYVGNLNYADWDVYLPNQTDFEDSDTSLWIKDKSNRYIFFMKFINSNTLELDGYFMGADHVLVWGLDTGCSAITDRVKSLEGIKSIGEWLIQNKEVKQ